MNVQKLNFIFISLLTCNLVGCSIKRIAVGQMTGVVEDGIVAFETDSDLELVEKSIPANIKLLEVMLASDPENRKLLALLSRLYGSYAFGFIETQLEAISAKDEDDARIPYIKESLNRNYVKAQQYALRAILISNPKCEELLKIASKSKDCFASLGKSDVPAIYWYGFNVGSYINRNLSSVTALSKGHIVAAAMNRVNQLNEKYFHSGANLFLVAYYGSRSKMMGGDPDLAKKYYQRAKAITGDDYWLADVFYARYPVVQKQDSKTFVSLLSKIKSSALPQNSDQRFTMYNQVAKERAKIYLSQREDLID